MDEFGARNAAVLLIQSGGSGGEALSLTAAKCLISRAPPVSVTSDLNAQHKSIEVTRELPDDASASQVFH